jgi:hypothetical protein
MVAQYNGHAFDPFAGLNAGYPLICEKPRRSGRGCRAKVLIRCLLLFSVLLCNILAAGHAVLACGEIVPSDFSMNQEPTEAIHAFA